ncbi:hypothetical protein HAX54_037131 [Datura stramonium]|uniref:Uncharacterized protein n=1 Tax=Datura stramonium TaxID=4076 RepID=A0ABS8VLV6_DATST|nr:hypothetical protein [Datura stramonium]
MGYLGAIRGSRSRVSVRGPSSSRDRGTYPGPAKCKCHSTTCRCSACFIQNTRKKNVQGCAPAHHLRRLTIKLDRRWSMGSFHRFTDGPPVLQSKPHPLFLISQLLKKKPTTKKTSNNSLNTWVASKEVP